jgi:RNAse (barnase) inhibitor barstar
LHVERLTKAVDVMEYELDGSRFRTLQEFFDEISAVLIPGSEWGRNLDAFNDILRGGFGTPDGGFTIRWRNSALSKECLGYLETVKQLESRLERCHPSNRNVLSRELADARAGRGPTVFDWLVAIVRSHGTGGDEAEDGVELILD